MSKTEDLTRLPRAILQERHDAYDLACSYLDEAMNAGHKHGDYSDTELAEMESQRARFAAAMAPMTQELERRKPLISYTAFCRATSDSGTTWINGVEASDIEQARAIARQLCAQDWMEDTNDVECVGLIKGDIEVAFWEDQTGD